MSRTISHPSTRHHTRASRCVDDKAGLEDVLTIGLFHRDVHGVVGMQIDRASGRVPPDLGAGSFGLIQQYGVEPWPEYLESEIGRSVEAFVSRPPSAPPDECPGWVATTIELVRFAVHVNGMGGASALFTTAAVTSMPTASSSNARYARGWAVNAVPNPWHAGSLPGTRSVLVTASNGMSGSALCNSRAAGTADTAMGNDLDDMMWRIVNGVGAWPSYNLL